MSLRRRDASVITQIPDQGLCQLVPHQGELDRLEKTASISCEGRPPGTPTVLRQVLGKAGKSTHKSGTGSGLVRAIRVQHSPMIGGKVCTDRTGPRTALEMGPDQQAWL